MKLKQPLTYKKYRRSARPKQISNISDPKLPNAPPIPWPQDVVKLPTVGALLYGLTLYEPLEIWTAAPRGNEIRASEENLWFLMVWTRTSLNISWNFRKFAFSKNHMAQHNSLQNNDRDMRPGPKWSSNKPWHTKNTAEARDLNKFRTCSVQSGPTYHQFHDRKTWSSCPLSAYYSTG